MRPVFLKFVEALFRVLFTYDCIGEEHVPAEGPAVVAANHPSYLDPILLSLQVPRPIYFMAWEALFRVPFLGPLIRGLGAFPVDVRPGKGREAYLKAKALVEAGEVVGIFPEGKRSRTGWMEPALREGAARLAWETGAPLVPASIAGAYRAWPHFQSLPRPARVRVRYHQPIDPRPYLALPAEEALPSLLTELRRRVDRSLLPGVKADLRMNVLYRMPSPWPRFYESMPALGQALLAFWKTRSLWAVVPGYAYVAYLLLDRFVLPQSRLAKWIRNASPMVFVLAVAPATLRLLGIPEPPAGAALVATLAGAAFAYLYARVHTALTFVRGFVTAALLELAALVVAPVGAGPHIALPLYAAAFAWERRSVFWRYATPALCVYVLAAVSVMGGGIALIPHAAAGLIAWLVVRLFPSRAGTPRPAEQAIVGLGLGS
jgi:1-acyl-sn-glycerol-3-phosphate acyltransferase